MLLLKTWTCGDHQTAAKLMIDVFCLFPAHLLTQDSDLHVPQELQEEQEEVNLSQTQVFLFSLTLSL